LVKEKRPLQPSIVLVVTSRKIRSSNCWRDLEGTPLAPPALIAASRSCEMRAREAASPPPLINAPRSCRLLRHSQTQRGRKGGWNPERVELHRRLPLRAGIAGQSLCPRQPAMCYAVELHHSMKLIRTSSYLRWRGAFCPAVSF
jgi:hypothetical protein